MKTRIALAFLFVSLAALGLVRRPTSEPLAFGWVPDRDEVRAVSSTFPQPDFDATPAYRDIYAGPDDVFLWDASRKVLGRLIPPRDQGSVGSCVAFGTASAIEHLLCVQAAKGANEEYRDLAQEIIYGGSRVEIGGGRIRGDGSVGAWAAKFVVDFGVLPRGTFGRFDLRAYDVPRCREFGRTGVPNELEPEVRQHPVKAVSNVKAWDEARAAIRNGYPVIVCSNQGFRATRDARRRRVLFAGRHVVPLHGARRRARRCPARRLPAELVGRTVPFRANRPRRSVARRLLDGRGRAGSDVEAGR